MAEGRPFVVDTAQATEFGSKRFHDKIHHEPQHGESHDTTTVTSSGSRFILPLRESKAAEVETVKPDKREKRGFFNLRHKVSLLHTKPAPSIEPPEVVIPQARPLSESTRKSLPLGQLFLSLPNELQIQVISSLPLNDVLNLRLASKSWHSLITLNEAPIVRYHLDHHIPAYARRLYPITESSELTFHYLCGLWHRLHVAAKLAYLICEWVTKDIFLRQTDAQRLAFAGQHERMRRRLIPLLFTAFHFFETYRKLHLEHIEKNGGKGLKREPYTVNPIEKQIMDMYDDQTLLRLHEVFPLIISSFCRRLRPPTYVGRVERSLRGYIRERPSDDIHAAILCLGGMRQVERLWEIKGYNSRRAAVDTWYNSLTKEAPSSDQPTKPRRSLMSFGRKKSTSGDPRENHRDPNRSSFSSLHRTRSPTGSIDGNESGFDPHWIFNTSLSAGVPMNSLNRDQAQSILDDLPVLQQIWMTTAEALILDRKIVGRSQDIKRNQQVMLDLIREDGLDEEDEWWYGRKLPDSVRPPTNPADDDAD